MDHEVLPRSLYLQLINDGVRVDRMRAMVERLKASLDDQENYASRKDLKAIIKQIETALMDTPVEQLKLLRKRIETERAEREIADQARLTVLQRKHVTQYP